MGMFDLSTSFRMKLVSVVGSKIRTDVQNREFLKWSAPEDHQD